MTKQKLESNIQAMCPNFRSIPLTCEPPVDQTKVITISKADRLTSTTASKSRSRCAGDKKLSPLVVPAMVKSAEKSASQPSVVSSPAVFKECFDQSSVFQPASAEPVVLCSILKPADASIPDGLNVLLRCCGCQRSGRISRISIVKF
uniref:Uncharacterized protein n=1 Tax=Ditylenchus dipsaci TaxID=166011 RepID=A0A915DBG1_9BILA